MACGSWQDLAGLKPGAVPPTQQAPGLPNVQPASEHQFQARQPARPQHFSAQAAGLATISPPCSPLHLPKLPRSIGKDALELLQAPETGTKARADSRRCCRNPSVLVVGGAGSIWKRHPKSRLYTWRPASNEEPLGSWSVTRPRSRVGSISSVRPPWALRVPTPPSSRITRACAPHARGDEVRLVRTRRRPAPRAR